MNPMLREFFGAEWGSERATASRMRPWPVPSISYTAGRSAGCCFAARRWCQRPVSPVDDEHHPQREQPRWCGREFNS